MATPFSKPIVFAAVLVALALALALVACGGGMAPPADRLATAEAAVRSAREHGAEKEPKASLHLKLADEQIGEGKKLMADGENKRADLVLQRAGVDAELANMLAKEATARAAADEAKDKVSNLKSGK